MYVISNTFAVGYFLFQIQYPCSVVFLITDTVPSQWGISYMDTVPLEWDFFLLRIQYQCVKLAYSLTGPAGLIKYFNTRPAVETLDRVSTKVTYYRPP